MKVLVACEESQAVCKAFRERGHEAYSCDIQECSGGHPEWHIQGDVLSLINGNCTFTTVGGGTHTIVGKWDLLIAFPPCTYLTSASSVRLFTHSGSIKDYGRFEKGKEAAEFFMAFLNADCEKVSVENPTPMKVFKLPRYSQMIEPYEFGHPYRKRTCLWLKGLPKLQPTEIVEPTGYWVGGATREKRNNELWHGFRDPKIRSKTFPGIAKAMAEQWGDETYFEPYQLSLFEKGL